MKRSNITYNNRYPLGTLIEYAKLTTIALLFTLFSNTVNGQIINNSGASFNVTDGAVVGSRNFNNASGGGSSVLQNNGIISLSGDFSNFALTRGNGLYRLDGNWTNNGIFNYETSEVLFKGTGQQRISTTNAAGLSFYNLSIANRANPSLFYVIMDNNITVAATLAMSIGNIDAQNFLLYVTSNTVSSLNYTSTTGSRVRGKFQRGVGERGSFLFPLGDAHYNPITLTANNMPDAGPVLSQFFTTDPLSTGLPIPDPPVEVWEAYPDGFWRLTAGNYFSSSNFNVSLNAEGFTDPFFPSTRLIKRTRGESWTVDGSHVDADTINQKIVRRDRLVGDISPTGTEFAVGRIRALIIQQPKDTTVCEDQDLTFSVEATGINTLRYFWYRWDGSSEDRINNNDKYSGARTGTLTIHNAQLSDIGDYFCEIRDRNNNRVSTDTVHLHVSKIPVATVSIDEQNHECSDIAFEDVILGLSYHDNASTFVWSRDNPDGIESAIPTTGTAYNIGDVLGGTFRNTSDIPITVTFTIIPVGPAPRYCAGDAIYTTVTVNPIPRVMVADTVTRICYGEEINLTLVSPSEMTKGNVVFDYTIDFSGNRGDIVGNSASAIGQANNTHLSFDYKNYADTINSVYFHVTPKSDELGCYAGVVINPEVKVHPQPLRTITITQQFTCTGGSDGILSARLAKTSTPMTLNWKGPWNIDDTFQTNDTISDYTIRYSGIYNLTVSDSMNCSNSINGTTIFGTTFETLFSMNREGKPYSVTCTDGSDGSVIISEITNADAPYNYWLLNQNQDTIRQNILSKRGETSREDGLKAGIYQLVIQDANGCYSTDFNQVRVTQPQPIKVTSFGKSDFSGFNISCTGYNDGSVWVEEVTGGNGGYTYEWFTNEGTITGDNTLSRLDNISAGKYYVRISDLYNCQTIDSVTLTEPDGMRLNSFVLSSSADSTFNISCAGGNEGYIEVDISGGLGNYTYSWSGNNGFEANTEDIHDISAGIYTLTAVDENGCFLKDLRTFELPEFILTEPEPLKITAIKSLSPDNQYNIDCYDGTGSIDITVTGGSVNNYSYTWTTEDGNGIVANQADQPNLTAGNYSLVVSDINGCIIDTTFTLTEPSPIGSALTPKHITCFPIGFDNGAIDLTSTGGIVPYGNFVWSNGATTEDISNLTQGLYSVTYTDANGCVKRDSITINLPEDLVFTTTSSDYNGYNISCFGASDGWIKLHLTSGTAPYSITWQKEGAGYISEADSISGLTSGRYIVHVIDANLCEGTLIVELTEPGKLSTTANLSSSIDKNFNINCFGDSTATIDIITTNNVGAVTYLWSDGFIGASRTNLPSGSYDFIISDINNCVSEGSIEITQPDAINLEFENTQPWCPDKPDGKIKLNVTGGVPDYKYLWSDNSTGDEIAEALPGIFTVAVTDFNGCVVEGATEIAPLHNSCLDIPNAISTNEDLINDVWNIGYTELYPNMVVKVFNRWGKTLWQSDKGYPIPWNGKTSRGRKLPVDSYHYVIDFGDGRQVQVGSITIVK